MNNSPLAPLEYSHLQHGDIIEVISPAYGVHDRDLKKITEYLESINLTARIRKAPEDKKNPIYSANLEARYQHLLEAIQAEDSKAIWCVKGGSGSPQLIPLLSQAPIPKKEKLFIGFSDITSLHSFFMNQWQWKSLHAPVLWQIAKERIEKASIDQIENIIFGKTQEVKNQFELKIINNYNTPSNHSQAIYGNKLAGGNLKLAQCSIGTNWQIPAKDNILIFEDVNEQPYQLDRILTHLLQSNSIQNAKAIIFADFEGGDEKIDMELTKKILENFSNQVNIPIFSMSGIGHDKQNYAIWLGAPARIELDKNNKIVLTTSK